MTPDRANRPGWIGYALALCLLLIVGVGAIALYGVPGSDGGLSPNQQETSGAPPPKTTGSR
jgi:hypothetical protein